MSRALTFCAALGYLAGLLCLLWMGYGMLAAACLGFVSGILLDDRDLIPGALLFLFSAFVAFVLIVFTTPFGSPPNFEVLNTLPRENMAQGNKGRSAARFPSNVCHWHTLEGKRAWRLCAAQCEPACDWAAGGVCSLAFRCHRRGGLSIMSDEPESNFPREHMEALWAPWRVEYYWNKGKEGDFLLRAAESDDDRASLVVERREHAFLIMNRYPYAGGHLMAVPVRKVRGMEDLNDAEKVELWDLVVFGQKLLRKVVLAEGFNVGINLGACAGAGKEDHLHIHIVPRWPGDHNFMTVTGHERVIPEGLMPVYDRLIAAAGELKNA